jgi:hypothetical protein
MSNATYGSIKPEPAGFQPFKVKDGGRVCRVGGWVGAGGEREKARTEGLVRHIRDDCHESLKQCTCEIRCTDSMSCIFLPISRSLLGKISITHLCRLLIHDVSGGLSSDVYV